MKKVISRSGAKLVLTGEGIELRRGIFGGATQIFKLD